MKMIISSDIIGTTINLRIYPTAFVGTSFDGCKVLSILDAGTASTTGLINPAVMHSQVYNTIPTENLVDDDYESYTYVKVKLADGSVTIIGDAWIIPTSVTPAGIGTITLAFEGYPVSVMEEIKLICQKNGYPPSSSKYTS